MNRRRILGLLMTGALSVGMLASSASAATINMNGTAAGYGAYQIMSLDQGVKNGHTDGDACDLTTESGMADHYAYRYALNEKYAVEVRAAAVSAGVDLSESATDADVIKAIENFGADEIRAFANAVFNAISSKTADATTDGQTFNVDPGYYLIFETNVQPGDSVSLVMLDTAGKDDITVSTKEDVPQLTKKIVNGDFDQADNRQDSDLVAVGDTVKYELRVTAPKADILAQYNTYKYVIHDDISDGLSYNNDAVVYLGDSELKGEHIIRGADGNSDNCELEVEISDVKQFLASNPDGLPDIIVRYTCTVTDAAVAGAPGNPNTAHLQFSNNPYIENATTVTPPDKVAAFTFQLQVNKVDESKQALAGAEFALSKKMADGSWGEAVAITPVSGSGGASFLVSGLDIGDYKLTETKTPDGYQKIDDVLFTIGATADTESDDPQLLTLTVTRDGVDLTQAVGDEGPEFSAEMSTGKVATAVVNMTGNRLPTTGGAGVYALYVGGAMLVFGGTGLMLYTNKKKKSDA